jgi:hypothetical protein
MATTLSGPLSDTGGCLISQRFALAAVSGRPLQKSRRKSSGARVLSCRAFRGSDRFTAAVSIRQRQAPSRQRNGTTGERKRIFASHAETKRSTRPKEDHSPIEGARSNSWAECRDEKGPASGREGRFFS